MKPPSNDANRPNPQGTDKGATSGKPASGASPTPSTAKPEPGKPDSGKPEFGKSDPGKPAVGSSTPSSAPSSAPAATGAGPTSASPTASSQAGKPGPAPASGVKPATPQPAAAGPGTPHRPDAAKDPAKADAPRTDGPKPVVGGPAAPKDGPAASIKSEPGKPDSVKAESGKTEPGKTEPERPGNPGADSRKPDGTGPRPAGGAVTDGPIIDLKAKRVPDPADAAKPAPGAKPNEAPKPAAASPAPKAAATASSTTPPAAEPRRGAGFGSLATAGLVGGLIGAGLLFGVDRGGLLGSRDDARLNALEQRVSAQIAGLATRDAVAALDKRVAADEAALKPLPEAVKNAESTAKQALAQATGGSASGETPQSLPPDIVSRLDSLDQRVSALQEEPGKEAGKAPATDQQSGAQAPELAALAERVKALESAGGGKPAEGTGDLGAKLAALQGEVESRTKANSEADQALSQRLDALRKNLDERVKSATDAIQSATQASQQAAEAGRTQAQEAAKAAERAAREQSEKIAALDKAVGERAPASSVQAALRVVAADRIAAALAGGAPYPEPLATLRKLEPADQSRLDALAPFAETGAPSAAQLAAEFRPIAEKAAAARRSAQAKSVAESGDLKAKLLGMAESIVQVRKVDAPPASGTEPEVDPLGKVQAELDRGAIQEAAKAFDAMPDAAKAEAAAFGQRLKARAAAAQASQALLSDAFKSLPAGQ